MGLHKLHESMLRSERTRPSLSMQTATSTSTSTTQRQQEHEYEHNQQRVSQIIDSVQTSSYDVNMCLQSVIYHQQQQQQQSLAAAATTTRYVIRAQNMHAHQRRNPN